MTTIHVMLYQRPLSWPSTGRSRNADRMLTPNIRETMSVSAPSAMRLGIGTTNRDALPDAVPNLDHDTMPCHTPCTQCLSSIRSDDDSAAAT